MASICYYTCALVPPSLLAQRGHLPLPLTDLTTSPVPGSTGGPSVHSTTCPWVLVHLATVETLEDGPDADLVVVPAGCDAMRRLGDVLAERLGNRVFRPWVPRSADPAAVERFASELRALDTWLAFHAEAAGFYAPDFDAHPTAGDAASAAVGGLPAAGTPGGVFVVGGPLADDGLVRVVVDAGLAIAGVESCTAGSRYEALAAAPALQADGLSDLEAVARHVLTDATCPRSSTGRRRAHLRRRLDETAAGSVIYARLPFCDAGAYDCVLARGVATERDVPFLELEVDYPARVTGPVRTRLEAFLETLALDDPALDDLFD